MGTNIHKGNTEIFNELPEEAVTKRGNGTVCKIISQSIKPECREKAVISQQAINIASAGTRKGTNHIFQTQSRERRALKEDAVKVEASRQAERPALRQRQAGKRGGQSVEESSPRPRPLSSARKEA